MPFLLKLDLDFGEGSDKLAWLHALIASGLLLLLGSKAWAASGASLTLPQPGRVFSRPSGLRIDLSSHWVDANGYRPVHVEVISAFPAVADRRLSITIEPFSYYPLRESQAIQFELVLPQGAKWADCVVPVPQRSMWQQMQVTTYEDGQYLEDLSDNLGWLRTGQRWGWTEAYPSMLFIDSDMPSPGVPMATSVRHPQPKDGEVARKLPDIRSWLFLLPPDERSALTVVMPTDAQQEPIAPTVLTDQEVLSLLQSLSNVAMIAPADLPKRWIEYTCFDLILISLDDLAQLAVGAPEAWAALRRYVTAGGNLLVYGVGSEFQKLGQLHELVEGRPASEIGRLLGAEDGWRYPRGDKFGQPAAEILQTGNYVQVIGPGGAIIRQPTGTDGETRIQKGPAPVPDSAFCLRDLAMGCVVAIESDEPLPVKEQRDWLLAELGPERWQWFRRHGMSQQRVNDGFWDLLIPGVGAAPVIGFLLIITAFVVTIGPVNYWLLRRWNRLYLLLMTVPLGAAIVTGGLLAYALLSDGLGTRTRIRSLTQINAAEGSAVSWSRQTYYAGVAPSGGLDLPQQTAVYPLESIPTSGQRRRRFVWDDRQRLVAGYLRSRTTNQFLVIHASPTNIGLRVERESGDAFVTVENRLQVEIQALLVIDDGEFFWGESLPTGGPLRLEKIDESQVKDSLLRRRAVTQPSIPVGFEVPRSRRRFFGNSMDDAFDQPDTATSLLERRLSDLWSFKWPAGRSYCAITELAPATVPLGVNRVRQEVGLHVIQGTW